MCDMEDLLEAVGVGLGLGVACLEPRGLNPLPLNGLTRPVGDPLLELTVL